MPLSELQAEILHLLAAHRNPESDVAGRGVLNRRRASLFSDIDIFHDREAAVAQAADADAADCLPTDIWCSGCGANPVSMSPR